MPTDFEIKELCDKCTWTWVSISGHAGYKVTGPNGNSIFFPAAGFRSGTDAENVGEYGYYWSSALSLSDSFSARFLLFYSGYHDTLDFFRMHGYSVRPVTE